MLVYQRIISLQHWSKNTWPFCGQNLDKVLRNTLSDRQILPAFFWTKKHIEALWSTIRCYQANNQHLISTVHTFHEHRNVAHNFCRHNNVLPAQVDIEVPGSCSQPKFTLLFALQFSSTVIWVKRKSAFSFRDEGCSKTSSNMYLYIYMYTIWMHIIILYYII